MSVCADCGRPIWDGGHAINSKECSGYEGCELHAEVLRLRGALAKIQTDKDAEILLAKQVIAAAEEVWNSAVGCTAAAAISHELDLLDATLRAWRREAQG